MSRLLKHEWADNCVALNKRSLSHSHGWKEKENCASAGRSKEKDTRNVQFFYIAKGLYLQTSQHSKVHKMGTEQHAGQLEQSLGRQFLTTVSALLWLWLHHRQFPQRKQSYRIIRQHGSDVYVFRNYLVQNGCSYIMHLRTSAKLVKLTETFEDMDRLILMS